MEKLRFTASCRLQMLVPLPEGAEPGDLIDVDAHGEDVCVQVCAACGQGWPRHRVPLHSYQQLWVQSQSRGLILCVAASPW